MAKGISNREFDRVTEKAFGFCLTNLYSLGMTRSETDESEDAIRQTLAYEYRVVWLEAVTAYTAFPVSQRDTAAARLAFQTPFMFAAMRAAEKFFAAYTASARQYAERMATTGPCRD